MNKKGSLKYIIEYDNKNKINKIIKYFLNFIVVFLIVRYIPNHKINDLELFIIGLLCSINFIILDYYGRDKFLIKII